MERDSSRGTRRHQTSWPFTLCTAPMIAPLLGGLLLRERLTRLVALALAGALLGTGLLVGVRPEGAEDGRLVVG